MTPCGCEACFAGKRGRKINKYCVRTHFTMPKVRQVFAPLLAQNLVSIQPMSLPVGSIFYLDYTYGSLSTGSKDK
jgi:hypothetical protein